ncbi:MAG: AsmA family protein, partial [Alphaproteobacteria bacterium]|nr:AsmA family protein [Alphaproteobacteria bacterium]
VQASELVPATPIPYQSFSIVNADIKLTIGKLIINDTLQADNVNMTLQLKDSILAISPFKMSLGGGNVSGSLAMAAPTQRATLQIVGNKLLLQNLHKEFQISGNGDFGVSEGGNLDFDIKLKSKGNTWRSIVNNLDGQVAAVVGNTQIQTGKFKFITSTFVAQLLDILGLKKDTSQKIDIACAALHSDLSDGKATFPQGIALESKQIYLVSDGSINLQNDKIDFSIQPNIKDVNLVQAISSFIKIKGTLQNPKLTLDNTSAAKAIIGVAATGGTAYLGSQFMSSDSAPCHTALKGTVYASRFPAPQGAINNAKDVYQGAEKQINKSIKDLKNTAKDVINIFKNSLKSNKIETSNGAQ